MQVDRRDPTEGGRALGAWPADGSPASPYDSVDRRIIALLQQNGRMSNTAIARAVGYRRYRP